MLPLLFQLLSPPAATPLAAPVVVPVYATVAAPAAANDLLLLQLHAPRVPTRPGRAPHRVAAARRALMGVPERAHFESVLEVLRVELYILPKSTK